MRRYAILALAFICLLPATQLFAQGYYTRTSVRNPVTGRQQIIDYQQPRWTSDGKGGFMFDGATGSLQVTAVRRNRFTGRLEYHNQFINPWTGARYTTGTQFNPFTGRYQTLHNFVPPPTEEEEQTSEPSQSLPRRGIRVIETNQSPVESPSDVGPLPEQTSSPTVSYSVEERQKPMSIKVITTPKVD